MNVFFNISYIQAGIMFLKPEKDIEEPGSLEVLQFDHILFPLIILGLGTFLAFLVFLCEIWRGKTKEETDQQPGQDIRDHADKESDVTDELVDAESTAKSKDTPDNRDKKRKSV